MNYNPANMCWSGGNKLSLLPYHPTYGPQSDQVTHLILRFKENNGWAVQRVKEWTTTAITNSEIDFLDTADNWYILSIPGSAAGVPNQPCESLCAHLASQFSWMDYCEGALVRRESVPKSATARKENRPRPTRADHERTIEYHGPVLNSSWGVLIVDDVLSSSNTFTACCGILRKATRCEHIFGFFVGRTQYTY